MKITKDRLNHSIEVARKMMDIARSEYNYCDDKINEIFVVGMLHDIGYEFSKTNFEHNKVGGEILRKTNFKHWQEVYYHGSIEIDYKSEVLDILNKADLSINALGEDVGVFKRLDDIKSRYGSESIEYLNAYKLAKSLNMIK